MGIDMTKEERAKAAQVRMPTTSSPYVIFRNGYIKGATEQRAIDIKIIPQLYIRWIMIEGDKPSWEEYATKVLEEEI